VPPKVASHPLQGLQAPDEAQAPQRLKPHSSSDPLRHASKGVPFRKQLCATYFSYATLVPALEGTQC